MFVVWDEVTILNEDQTANEKKKKKKETNDK